MPGPSFQPLLASIGAAFLLAGLVFGPWVLVAGIVALILALLGWLNDARKEYVKVEEADVTGHLENLPDPRLPSVLLATFAVLVIGAVLLQTGAFPPGTAPAVRAARPARHRGQCAAAEDRGKASRHRVAAVAVRKRVPPFRLPT
jgi:hypothetical protein